MVAVGAAGIREGDILAGKYRVDRVLGAGGMGIVVSARHVQLESKVAIKLMLPTMLASPEAVVRFEREARAAVQISSEYVARVFDVGTLESGAPYIVMEFLEGRDLSAWLRSEGPMPVALATEFVLQACVAVAEAHALGIVHRDLKPSNLFCIRRADGQLVIKVLDFGISKRVDVAEASGMSATKTGSVMGSPLYMSPEQMASAKDVSPQSDIWSLGIILFELVAGSPPFSGDTLPEVCMKIALRPPPPLRAVCPGASPAFESVIATCLEKDRKDRYADVSELARALVDFAPQKCAPLVDRIVGILHGSNTTVPMDAVPSAGSWPSHASASSSGSTATGTTPAKGRWIPAVAVAAIVGAVLAGVMVARWSAIGSRGSPPLPDVHVASSVPVTAPVESVVTLPPPGEPAIASGAASSPLAASVSAPAASASAPPRPMAFPARAPTAPRTAARPGEAPPTKVDTYDHM